MNPAVHQRICAEIQEKHARETAALRAELAKHQESEFHPDWSLLAATRDSLAEHQQMIVALREELERECADHKQTVADAMWSVKENKALREALEIIAAQSSGVVGSTARSDCMAAIARAALNKEKT